MFWLGVSMLVMSLTGIGDDSRAFLDFLKALDQAVEKQVLAEGRRKLIHQEIDRVRSGFLQERADLGAVGDCIEKLDRDYAATREAYEACGLPVRGAMMRGAETLVEVRGKLQKLTTEDERESIRKQVVKP